MLREGEKIELVVFYHPDKQLFWGYTRMITAFPKHPFFNQCTYYGDLASPSPKGRELANWEGCDKSSKRYLKMGYVCALKFIIGHTFYNTIGGPYPAVTAFSVIIGLLLNKEPRLDYVTTPPNLNPDYFHPVLLQHCSTATPLSPIGEQVVKIMLDCSLGKNTTPPIVGEDSCIVYFHPDGRVWGCTQNSLVVYGDQDGALSEETLAPDAFEHAFVDGRDGWQRYWVINLKSDRVSLKQAVEVSRELKFRGASSPSLSGMEQDEVRIICQKIVSQVVDGFANDARNEAVAWLNIVRISGGLGCYF